MKRSLFILSFLFILTSSLKSQIVQIANETFEGTLSGWTINPSSSWKADTNLYAGGQTSYRGYVPIGNPGDAVILTSPIFDLKPYGYAYLTFNQICKVSGSDICQIEYRENTMNSTWKAIPRSSYKGSGLYTNDVFHEGSYTDWLSGDSLAVPTNSWWKAETFDVSNEVSFTEVQFRFKITKGSVIGTHFAYGWLIDNFQLIASVNPIASPVVELLTPQNDTVYNTGPFTINAKAASRTMTPMLTPTLYYSATYDNITINDSILMTAIDGDSIWTCNMPQFVFGSMIKYTIVASDSVGNIDSLNESFYIKNPAGVLDSNAVALLSVDNPASGVLGGEHAVKVTVKNKGINYLDSCYINWMINGALQDTVVWRGHLPEDFNDTITIGYYTPRKNMYDTVDVWVSMPNGVIDATTSDDAITSVFYKCYGPLSGDLIVGRGSDADASSIADVFTFVSLCGISGDISLKFQNGTYNENWNFSNLSNIMGNYTLTITSLSGNRDSVILKPISGVGVVLNNTDNLIIKDISIDNTGSVAYGVQFTGTAKNIEFRNIHFIGNTTVTTTAGAPAPIYKAASTGVVDDIRFIGNLIDGGYYGIYFYGGTGSAAYGTNIVVDSNIITNQYYYSISFQYNDFSSLSHNTILSRTANTYTQWRGMHFNYCNLIANCNRVHQLSTSITSPTLTYFSFIGCYNTTNPSIFYNNEIIGYATSTYYAMSFVSTNKINIYHNSIYISGSDLTRCLNIANNTSSNYNIKNNIFVNGSNGYPIYFAGTTTPFSSDYNCFYATSKLGYFSGGNKATLSAWQTATGQDLHSIVTNPSFIDVSSSLKLSHYTGLDCHKLSDISYDIEGTFRSLMTYMGCYSAPLVGANATLVEILNLDNPAYQGNTSGLEIVILNSGLSTIQAASFNWKINNATQPMVNWTGNVTSESYDTITLGNIIYQSGYNEIVIWLAGLGALTDGIPFDDSLKVSIYVCTDSISGDIVVGNAPGANFTSVNDVFYIANLCGVKGDINVKLQNGVYVENWNIIDLADQIGNHSLNITSLSGNKDSVIIRPTSGDVVVFNNSNNVNISHITIDAVNGNYAVNFTGRASNVLFENCNLYVNSTSTATTYGVIYKPSASGLLDEFTIRKCNINGGYYGVYIYGSESAYDYNITIDSNTFINQYYYGIYLYYVNSKSTSYNKITSRTANAGVNWYGIWSMYHRKGGNIIGNRIFTDNASITSDLYGIRLYFIDTALVANNEIYFNSKALRTNGIYFDYPVAVECIHNSVLLTGTSANSRPLYCWVYDSDDYDITIKNNNFVTTSSGFLPYAIFLDGTYSSAYDYNYRIDYNNYYSSGNLASVGGDKSDLASWQSTVTTDRNSVNVYPLFVDSLQNLKLINYSQLSCPRYEPINYDINHSNRLVRTAMGCYSPEIESVNGALVEVLNWKSMGYLGDSSQMKVVFFNFGSTNITSATIDWKFNNISQPSINWSGNLALGESDTIGLGTVYYIKGANELIVWINKLGSLRDTFLFDDTVIVSSLVCDSMLNGYYTIGSTGDFSDMDEVVDVLSLCGINGPVTFAIQPGTYYQNTTIGYINGSSPTNTITFTSTTGDSSDVVLQRADDATSSLAPVMITDGENIIIKDLTLSGLGPVTPTKTFSHGIIINGNSRNIEVKNCHIFVPKNFPTAVTLQNHNPVRIMDSVSNVRIINNLIEGGSCGVYVYGVNPAVRARNIVVKENTISEVDNYGFWMYYVDSILIEGNMIEQRTGNFSPGHFYGICAYYINCDILSNRIHAASLASAIYTNNLNSPSRLSLIANNEIIGTITGTSYRGMNFTAPSCAKIYQNSMYLEGIDAIIGLSVENDAGTYVDIKNNNLIINSTGNAYPIYLAGTAYIGTQWFIDYNNYYNLNGVNIGYAGGARTSLVDWKNVVSTDIHSINTFPNFIDVNKNLELFDYSPFVVPSIQEVAYDIKYNQRTRSTTMGAYSVALYDGYDLALKTILSREEVKNIHCYGDFTNIQVVVKNEGSEKYNFNQDNVLFTVEVSGAINYKKDTLISLGNLLPAQSDTIEITNILPITTQGFYHIKTFLTSSLDTIYDDDTLSTVYGIHKIQLPYDIDFSTVPVEILQKQIVGKSSWAVEPDTGSTSEITPVFGTGRLTFHSESNSGSISQIIFNSINLIGINQPKLEFWYAHDNSNSTKRDFVSIKISTDGINSQLLDAVYRYDQAYTSPGWSHYTIDLSAYINEPCVSLIFEGNSFGGGNQNIDRIRLSSSSNDISLSYLSPLVSDLGSCNLNNISAKVILSNITGQNMDFDIDTSNIHFYISGEDSLYINYPLNGLLLGFEKDTITFNQTLDLSRNGVYDIIAYIDAIDDNPLNDTIKKRLLINPDLTVQDVVGIDEENCKRSGDSVYVSFKIVNMGNLTINEFPISLQINDVNVITDTVYQHMEPGDYITYTFDSPFLVPVVSDVQPYYSVKIQTELPCDAQPSNNIKNITACVDVEGIIDLTILSIDQPLESPCKKGLYPAQVAITLSNQGNTDIEEATVYVEIDSAGTLHASFFETTETIYARSILAHTFTATYNVPNIDGTYQVKVFVGFTEGDTNALNDTLIVYPCAIYNDVSVEGIDYTTWTLGQSIPNPAINQTRIPFNVPVAGEVIFELTTINGQVLHREKVQASTGSNSFELSTESLANGIYYYSMEYNGQRIVKKMTIQK